MSLERFAHTMTAVSFLGCALPVCAGGLYIYDVNPADTVTPRSVWLNPAGMTAMQHSTVQATAGVVVPVMKFDSDLATAGGQDGDNAGEAAVLPDLAYVRPLGGNWWVGLSLTGLFGGEVNYGDDFVGRYSVTEVKLSGIGLVPSIAYRFNDAFSIGAGVSITQSKLDQKIAFRNLAAPDGQIHFDELDDWGVQPFVGVTYRLNPHTLMGLVYRAEMDIELAGDVQFTNIAPNVNPSPNFRRDVQIDWTNAQTVELGLEYEISDHQIMHLTGSWEDWSTFDNNVLAVDAVNLRNVRPIALKRNWKDTYSAGGDYVHMFGKNALRFGVNYVSSPVDDEDRTFDLPYDEYVRFNLGYVFEPRGRVVYTLGGSVTLNGDAEIDQTFLRGTPLQSRVAGEFDTNVIFVVGGAIRYAFD